MPEFSITVCCASMHMLFKYVVPSLSLKGILKKKKLFLLTAVLKLSSNKITFQHLFTPNIE